MKHVVDSAKRLSFVRPCLVALGLFLFLLLLTGAWPQPVAAAEGDDLTVFVDGRAVTVESVEAQLKGATTTYTEVLKVIGSDVITADLVEVFAPPDTPISVTKVTAEIHGRAIKLVNLTQPLAARGRIGIWISGSNWRVCVIIVWGSNANLDVSVDSREVTVEGTEAELDGQPTELRRVLALLGAAPVTADKIELFDPATPSNTKVLTSGVQAVLTDSHLSLTGLAPELAARGRIGIWISGSRWRICIIIVWGSKANLDVTVDGRDVTVTGIDAEIEGQRTELRRVLTYLGSTAVTADKIELFDPATPGNTKVLTTGVKAVVTSNQVTLTGLAPELAARGRIGIWISGSKWRICIIIVWDSKANLEVSVDGRAVTVKGVEAEIDGQLTELRRVLALLGSSPVVAQKVELFKPGSLAAAAVLTDPVTITPTQKVTATVEGNQVRFRGLANTLAQYKTIGIWISGRTWRICIIIVLGSDNSPHVLVDGRPVIAGPCVRGCAAFGRSEAWRR